MGDPIFHSRTVTLLIVLVVSLVSAACPNDCNPHDKGYGVCVGNGNSSICNCRSGWGGSDCSVSYNEEIGVGWDIVNYIAASLFFIEAALSGVQTYRLQRASLRCAPDTLRLIHAILCFAGIERVLYLSIDAYGDKDIFPPIVENILFGLGISLILVVYTVLLYYRVEMYTRLTSKLSMSEGLGRRGVLLFLILPCLTILGIEFIFDCIRPSVNAPSTRLIFNACYYLFVVVTALAELSMFFIYGRKLYKRILEVLFSKESQKLKQQQLQRVQRVLLYLSILNIALFVSLVLVLILEASIFHYENPYSYLVEQTEYRAIELATCFVILWILKDSPKILSSLRTSKATSISGGSGTISLPLDNSSSQ